MLRIILSVALSIYYFTGSAQIMNDSLIIPNYKSFPEDIDYVIHDSLDDFELRMKTVSMPDEDIDTLLLARTIESYNSERIEELLIGADSSLSKTQVPTDRLRYLKLLRKIYGPVLYYAKVKGYVATFGKSTLRIQELQVHAEMKNAKGQLIMLFHVTRRAKKFIGMSFVPYYYVDVPFFSNTSFLTISLLRSKSISALIESGTKNFQSSVTNRKKFEKVLNSYSYDTLVPFSGLISTSEPTISLKIVYEMPSANKCLELYYREEDMKFKLDKLSLTDKQQD